MPRPCTSVEHRIVDRLEAIQEAQDPEKINEDYRWGDLLDPLSFNHYDIYSM